MVDDEDKPICKYGIKCYQRNEAHRNRFSHPSDNSDENKTEIAKRGASTSPKPKKRAKKLRLSLPTCNKDDDQENSGDKEDICVLNESNGVNGELNDMNRPSSSNQQNISTAKTIEEAKEKRNVKTTVATKPMAVKIETIDTKFIESNFLISMPDDFYTFWEFCDIESKSKSPELLFSKFGLRLVGPFDVLAKKFNKSFEKNEYLRHWRFYYDPPEFQTVMVKEKTSIHYGYWRDEPNGECLIARNNADDGCELTFVADNLFGAVLHYLDKDIQLSLFNRSSALTLKKSLERYANKENISLTSFSAKLKVRNSKVVSKTFHPAGLVVPFNRKTDVGYRPLGESDVKLKKLLKKFDDANGDKGNIMAAMDELQPLITAANIACDECDFGNTIELGIDLFCFGSPELHPVALQLLSTGYSMVKRPEYIDIIKSHLEDRKKGCTGLSILGT